MIFSDFYCMHLAVYFKYTLSIACQSVKMVFDNDFSLNYILMSVNMSCETLVSKTLKTSLLDCILPYCLSFVYFCLFYLHSILIFKLLFVKLYELSTTVSRRIHIFIYF